MTYSGRREVSAKNFYAWAAETNTARFDKQTNTKIQKPCP